MLSCNLLSAESFLVAQGNARCNVGDLLSKSKQACTIDNDKIHLRGEIDILTEYFQPIPANH